jgi:hypothetical protein
MPRLYVTQSDEWLPVDITDPHYDAILVPFRWRRLVLTPYSSAPLVLVPYRLAQLVLNLSGWQVVLVPYTLSTTVSAS